MDPIYNDFMNRFDFSNAPKRNNHNNKPLSSGMGAMPSSALNTNYTSRASQMKASPLATMDLTPKAETSEIEMYNTTDAKINDLNAPQNGMMSKLGQGASMGLAAAPAAMGMFSDIKGDQFDTSAEGGGPGKVGGHVLKGAATGAQQGAAIAGPYGAVIGGVIGGAAPLIGYAGKQEEYIDNQKKLNKKESYFEKAQREDQYRMEEGLASINNLKALREKQLGILS